MDKTHILFVDDEQNVLRSLQRTMLSTGYKVYTANTSRVAMEILATEPIDIFVSDVKMTDISGVDLLLYVKKEYPQVHRMILSGYIETEHVLRAILNSTTFDYLSKPWSNEELIQKIQHIVRIRGILNNPDMRKLVHDIEQLPIIPEVYNRFEKAVDEEAPIEEISKIISSDLGMSSKVLQLANTAFYSATSVNSIHKAVSIIGLRTVKQLMFAAIFLQEDFLETWQIKELRIMSDVYARTNRIMSALYYYCYSAKMRDDFSILGFTFDIGKLILLRFKPDYYKEIIIKMNETGKTFHECEILLGHNGVTHREIGGYFLNLWNFSRISIEASIFHHHVEEVSEEFAYIIQLMDFAYDLALINEEGLLEALENPQTVDWNNLDFGSFHAIKSKLDVIRDAEK